MPNFFKFKIAAHASCLLDHVQFGLSKDRLLHADIHVSF